MLALLKYPCLHWDTPVEYLHFGGNKADGRWQIAEGKEQGCKLEGNDNCLGGHDIAVAKATLDSRFHTETLTRQYASLLPSAICYIRTSFYF